MSAPLAQRTRPAAGNPEGALVLLHGRGADEHDLFGLLDLLDPQRRLLGVTVGGPLALPPGGKHWYVVPRVGFPDPDTFAGSFAQLSAFLDGLGIAPERTVLGGFSQGSVMSWALALGPGRPAPAGVIGLSGFIPTVPGWEFPGRPLRAAIGHGTMDPVIGVDFGRAARDRLQQAGADVTYHESAIGHQIDPRFLATLPAWLEETLPSS
ncbi:MAG TPA: phospholipase [Capillimicrobium sp.]|jgi:phospholipase/carboxylesterase